MSKNKKVRTISGKDVDVGATADHAAVEAVAPRKIVTETDWFELKGLRVKAVKVAPSVYQAARAHLRALMRGNMPEPPKQLSSDGTMKPNPFHSDHIKAMAEWEELYADLDEDLFMSIAVLAGLYMHPEDEEKIPPEEMWLPGIEMQLAMIGINLSTSTDYLMYSGDRKVLKMLLFKKYILLDDPKTFKAYMDFQKSSQDDGVPMELMSRYAADMFRGPAE